MIRPLLFARRNPAASLAALGLFAACILPLSAMADWLHYRGPAQNGVSPERVRSSFSAAGPRIMWKANLGIGTSAIVVSGDRAYSMGNVDDRDVIYCLDVRNGKEIWRHTFPLSVDARMFEGGPAATPTIDGNRIYTVSHQGDLWCLNAATGRKVWYKHYQQDFAGSRPRWGYAGSPTVEGRMLILDVGGSKSSTVALDKTNANVIWKSGSDGAGYGSPVVEDIDGRRTIVIFKAAHVVGLDPKDGRELWRSGWKTDYDVNAATPLVIGDRVFISSGYNAGCAMVEISGGRANELWRNKNLRSQISSPTFIQGAIFGMDGQTDRAHLVCLDPATGQREWEERNVKGGALIAADGKLIVITERGELVMAEASPAGFRPLARAQVIGGRCWVQPTLSRGRLFVRNNQGQVVCLDVSSK